MSIDTETSPLGDPNHILVGLKDDICLFSHSDLNVLMQLPLPGVVIFVHGVNSDGEWYEQAEQGLCKGLNARLARCDEQLKHCGPEAGQLSPARYIAEINPDGYINPDMNANSFIQSDDTFSPVIRFRWGYKASSEELQTYGKGLFLNEQNYWGGGPFANGCTTLPDLWGQGLSDNLFLWLHVQHLNPTNDRQVYTCPPRPYFVLAAYRLAKLVESLRRKQADVPITIVCHSQGNMVGMAAAFLGDAMKDATDAAGHSGRCVADTYVLCNAPYSLVKSNGTESWSERGMADREGRTGRQTVGSRTKTLAAFFDIVRKQAPLQQDPARIDRRMANEKRGFTAAADRGRYGLNSSTYGRVTLYCNPHDQVISSTTVQGIGWRGLSNDEVKATGGTGVFTQRVFAQGFEVGRAFKAAPPLAWHDHRVLALGVEAGTVPKSEQPTAWYDYWADHYRKPKMGSHGFWFPESQAAQYSIRKGLDANDTGLGRIVTVLTAPFVIFALKAFKTRINALPPNDWKIPLQAPPLPEPFVPESLRWGASAKAFDEGKDAPGEYRDKDRQREAGDPYSANHTAKDGRTDEARGGTQSEAALRYEHHAALRMQAKREDRYHSGEAVTEEDQPQTASEGYKAWRNKKIDTMLAANLDTHATDHSTIMTNPLHAEKALAYDVAIGNCDIREKDLHQLRIAADWRFVGGLGNPNDPHKEFVEYFKDGRFKEKSTYEWANPKDGKGSDGSMPPKIADEREYAAPQKWEGA